MVVRFDDSAILKSLLEGLEVDARLISANNHIFELYKLQSLSREIPKNMKNFLWKLWNVTKARITSLDRNPGWSIFLYLDWKPFHWSANKFFQFEPQILNFFCNLKCFYFVRCFSARLTYFQLNSANSAHLEMFSKAIASLHSFQLSWHTVCSTLPDPLQLWA